MDHDGFERLAERRQWAELWSRVRAAPLLHAVTAMPLFGDWQPGDPADRALFGRLAAMDPSAVAAAATPAATTVPIRFCNHFARAPDLSQVAFGTWETTEVYTLLGGHVASLPVVETSSPWADQLVWVDDAVISLEYRESGSRRWRVVRHRGPGWKREVLADDVEGHVVALGAVPAGFVVVGPQHVSFGTSHGPLGDPVRPAFLDVDERMALLDTEPSTGRLAVAVDAEKRLVVLDTDLRVLGERRLEHGEAHHGWFCWPDILVTYGRFQAIRSRRVDEGALVVTGHDWVPKHDVQFGEYSLPLGLTTLPGHGVLAFARNAEPPLWYDARTLAAIAAPAPFGDLFPVWISPDESLVVTRDYQGHHLHDLGNLALSRLVTTTPAHLAAPSWP